MGPNRDEMDPCSIRSTLAMLDHRESKNFINKIIEIPMVTPQFKLNYANNCNSCVIEEITSRLLVVLPGDWKDLIKTVSLNH